MARSIAVVLALVCSVCAGAAPVGGSCDGACDEDVGLLQVHSASAPVAVAAPRAHYVIDMRRAARSSRGACSSGISMEVVEASVHEQGGTWTYDVSNLTGGSFCSGSGDFGPSSCCGSWGGAATVSFGWGYTEAFTPEWTVTTRTKIQAWLLFGYVDVGTVETSCPICGKPCEIPKITLAHLISIPGFTVETPACPEQPEIDGTVDLIFPESSPVSMGVRTTTEVKLKKPCGRVLASAEFASEAHP